MDSALETVRLIPKQCKQAFEEAGKIEFDQSYRDVENIAIAGMGGSIYVYYVLETLFKEELKIPLIKVNSYGLPLSVSDKTLFVASSYSGTTEEVIYNLGMAHERGAQTFAVSMGGKIIDMQNEWKRPYYKFTPTHNPSGQPRMGQGYMLFSMIAVLEKLGILNTVDMSEVENVEKLLPEMEKHTPGQAKVFVDSMPFFVAAEHLSGNAHILRNQTNETAKSYADYNLIPELNHHLMEGLKHPKAKKMQFIFFDSVLYHPRVRERFAITQEVVGKNGIETHSYTPRSKAKLGQFLEVLIWGGYFTYYLSKEYNENANAIPWVDYFKEKLGPLPVEQ